MLLSVIVICVILIADRIHGFSHQSILCRRFSNGLKMSDTDRCGPCPLAPKCSGAYSDKGCDGTGKIQGGIATFPLLSWWPIKVFRPCPAYLEAGYQYKREGQTMDQVLFSEPSTKMRQKMDALRAEKDALEKSKDEDKDPADVEVELTEVEKLLKDRFG